MASAGVRVRTEGERVGVHTGGAPAPPGASRNACVRHRPPLGCPQQPKCPRTACDGRGRGTERPAPGAPGTLVERRAVPSSSERASEPPTNGGTDMTYIVTCDYCGESIELRAEQMVTINATGDKGGPKRERWQDGWIAHYHVQPCWIE